MAHSIGNNPLPHLPFRPDPGQTENLRQTSGTAAFQARTETAPEEGSELSAAARQSLQAPAPNPPPPPKKTETAPQNPAATTPAPSANLSSADKEEAKRLAAKLAAYDDPETVYRKVVEDIPEANAEAAERVLEGQMSQGLNKLSNLKTGPEAQEAGRMQMRQAEFMSEPLDIREEARPLPLELDLD